MAVDAQFLLCGSQDLMGNGFNHIGYSGLQIQEPQNQFKNQNFGFDFNRSFIDSSLKTNQPLMAVFEEKQRQEIDHLIRSQSERLRFLLQEQRKQHLEILMKKIESRAMPIIKQKEEEIEQARTRRRELEELIKRLEVENQVWQRVAQENEAMVLSLNNTIDQLREKASSSSSLNKVAEDAESYCENNIADHETEIKRSGFYIDDHDDQKKKKKTVCRGCDGEKASIVFMPCRHLCSCKTCEPFLDFCPVCFTVKKAVIEVLLF